MFCISAAADVTSYREVLENYATGVRQRIIDKTGYFRPDRMGSECSLKMDGLVSQISQQSGDSSAFQNNLQRCLGSFRALLRNVILPVSSIQTELAQFALMDLFINQQNLLDHLRILHNYFFLTDGAFSLAFVSGVYQRAARFPLRPCLDIIAFLDIFESSLNVYEENQSVGWMALAKKTLAVTILSGSSNGQERMPASYDIADYLCLQYEIPWPVGMLLTSAVMEQANGVLRDSSVLKAACGYCRTPSPSCPTPATPMTTSHIGSSSTSSATIWRRLSGHWTSISWRVLQRRHGQHCSPG
ncbi:uncharacterized protein LOC129594781 [Paramacrobiotus metropolitanus]|uniref:uncharacterized protein LOC129594781 n=1 Tax=Paramacrobiotus metropolitanus TaxID=2943436 RepID=UPI0024457521|nr:uncharacterized protein LOC129594781 [Paramacrobiotus metropolitanus]XP_055347554.1 uncharacterized protein LOC129594781 [Paramacrobiotus metropolitanus]